MIDTDKYEGHTHTKEWGNVVYADGYLPIFLNDGVYATDLDRELMADAPLLLAEVKRLRRLLRQVADEYTDADGITYEIYCEFGDEEE
jgi:hypothetical protein